MKTLRKVVDSHSANCFKSDFLNSCFQHHVHGRRCDEPRRLESSCTEQLAALNSVAGLAGSGRRLPGALGDGTTADSRSKIGAVPKGIHLDAEYGTLRE